MSRFADQLRAFAAKAERITRDTFVNTTTEVQRSVVEGSEVTGAPGQPVDLGNLKNSFIPQFTSNTTWETTTVFRYAPSIEDGFSYQWGVPLTLRSKVGGFHSVKLTRAGWERIIETAAKQAGAGR
jgi:hypothetical protein